MGRFGVSGRAGFSYQVSGTGEVREECTWEWPLLLLLGGGRPVDCPELSAHERYVWLPLRPLLSSVEARLPSVHVHGSVHPFKRLVKRGCLVLLTILALQAGAAVVIGISAGLRVSSSQRSSARTRRCS